MWIKWRLNTPETKYYVLAGCNINPSTTVPFEISLPEYHINGAYEGGGPVIMYSVSY